jgi:hypothetical protein
MQDATSLSSGRYPVRVSVEYPDSLSRLSTFFRVLLAIPVAVFLYAINGGIVGAMWAAILVRGRIPRWLFDFQVGYNRFSTRAAAYFLLLTDTYPAFEGAWVVDYDVDYPERVSRWKLLFWKVIASIPHFIVLFFLWIAVMFCVFIAWFAILFTGKFPRGLHSFVAGVLRWSARVTAYVESLTDVFPPYSMSEEAEPATNEIPSLVLGGVITGIIIAGVAVGAAVAYRYGTESETVTVSREDALAGTLTGADVEYDDILFELVQVEDDATGLLSPSSGRRLVVVTVNYFTTRGRESELDDDDLPRRRSQFADVDENKVRLKTNETERDPVLLTVDGLIAPVDVRPLETTVIQAYFDVPDDEEIEEVRAYTTFYQRRVEWVLE